MPKWRFLTELHVTWREFFIVFVLLFNVFTWYYMTLVIIETAVTDPNTVLILRAIFYVSTVGSALIGSILSERIRRLRFLYFWMIFGAVTSILLAFIEGTAPTQSSIIVLVSGVSFGLGMPSCLAYFADTTLAENRGRLSGIVFLATNLSAFPFTILLTTFSLTVSSMTLAIWRTGGLLLFAFLKPREEAHAARKHTSFASVFQNRSFILYFIPWLMFCLIDTFEKPLVKSFVEPSFYEFMQMIELLVASLATFAGGVLCDLIGRKRVVIYGFVSLGVTYAIIGIAPNFLLSWYFYLLLDGVAAGILWVLFIPILWGDLAQSSRSEKYYMVGNTPFLVTDIFSLVLIPLATIVPTYATFSLASFFLFLAVIPLMYAPETLPEKKIELRRVRGYIEQAKKVRDEYLGKGEAEG